MKENKRIVIRHYYAVAIRLASPINVSSGFNLDSDADVIRNGDGVPFIPGTSIAGAFRNYLDLDKEKSGMMGYSKGEEGKMSSLFLSDLYFEEIPYISLRDGVLLTDEKKVDNKFDMEIIETGVKGTLFFSLVIREGENCQEYENMITILLQGIQSGEIRIGFKKNRGFGRMEIEKIYEAEFTNKDVDKWLAFEEKERNLEAYTKQSDYKEWLSNKEKAAGQYIKISVPLKLTGGISIRRYSAKPNQADYEHIDCNGKPVIPGSSWAGAVRADVKNLLKILKCSSERTEQILKQWFGTVDVSRDKNREDAKQSQIVFSESILEGAEKLTIVRNQIDRFDASTKEGAMYTESSWFGGKTTLEILVHKDEEEEYLALLGMLQLVIQDIQRGYLPVGGQTAVGRGIFEADKEQEVYYSEERKDANSALYGLLFGVGGK